MACEPERVVIIKPPMPIALASGLGSVASILWAYVWDTARAAIKVTGSFHNYKYNPLVELKS